MKKSIGKNVVYKFILNLFNFAVPIIIGPYAYRVLGANKMGMVDYAQSISMYFSIMAGFGIYNYGVREISRVRENREKVKELFGTLFLIGCISSIITTVVYIPFVILKFGNSPLTYVLLILSIDIISNMFYVEWANEGEENYGFITIKTIIIRIIYIASLLIFVKNPSHYGVYAFVIVFNKLLNNLASFFYVCKEVNLKLRDIKWNLKKHIKPLIVVLILSNVNILYTQLDRIMLGSYVSKESVAYYTLGQKIMFIINSLVISIVSVATPRLSNYFGNNNDEKYFELLNKISRNFFMILYPIAIGIFCLADVIVYLYGGREFANCGNVLKIFSVYMISLGQESILSNNIMYVRKREKELTLMILTGGVVNFILNYFILFSGYLNENTAIFTTLLANILLVFLENFYIKKKMHIEFNIFSMDKSKYFLLSLIFIPVTYAIKTFIHNIFIFCILVIMCNALLYFLVLFIRKDDTLIFFLKKVNSLLSKLRNK